MTTADATDPLDEARLRAELARIEEEFTAVLNRALGLPLDPHLSLRLDRLRQEANVIRTRLGEPTIERAPRPTGRPALWIAALGAASVVTLGVVLAWALLGR
ncbi:hypothetical protein DEU34_3250 [Microbacterium sp. AG1240]|uniref:hypothetical protein n=1 Tax=Microbacterium sp. AG1240 TaxID=2183992 RepID=UPI000EAF294E|nr:hypothetical protein [Microbacterium sp. AG1240]RKT31311.1 hypothetical protein DEU34_3250 [Microbacterium sp. AG1240]